MRIFSVSSIDCCCFISSELEVRRSLFCDAAFHRKIQLTRTYIFLWELKRTKKNNDNARLLLLICEVSVLVWLGAYVL